MKVTVVVPCWNEAAFIAPFLDSVLAQTHPPAEILLVDGMSDDGTRDVAFSYAARHPTLSVLDNPGRSKPVALNLAVRRATGDVIMRLDVHAHYPRDYIANCVRALEQYPDADNVGGVRLSEPRDDSLLGKAIALSTTDTFGAGNSTYRTGSREPQWVDTVFGGCYRREVFDEIGLFDEALTRAQDREFNNRLRQAGGKILLLPDITCVYYPRSDYREYCSWIFEAGFWPFAASRSVGRWIGGWRNVVPAGFVLTVAGGALLSPFSRSARRLTSGVLLAYASAALASSARLALRHRDPRLLAGLPLIFATTHVVYGAGSLRALLPPRPKRPVDDGGKMSDPAASMGPTPPGGGGSWRGNSGPKRQNGQRRSG